MFNNCLLKSISALKIKTKLAKNMSKTGPIKSFSIKENSSALFAKISIGLNKKTINEAMNEINEEINNFSFNVYFSILNTDSFFDVFFI
ncbi:hypothetical protein [uncultured Eubacterium sp.]|uniref:hypothetical protein n=1 Tax=uncultured Eubacterium sp. TaxID=165185 RepID=UPI002805E310|nr:hypothetical protein [uncultured Eubacterium sp.]